MHDLSVTFIQADLHWEDSVKNLEIFSRRIGSINRATDLILLPEMFSTGFTMNAVSCAEEMDGRTVRWLQSRAGEKKCVIAGSVIIKDNGKYYNRLIWAQPDGSLLHYDKRHLFRLSKEEQTYTPGNNKIIPEIKGWKICPLICYDLRFPVWSRRTRNENYDVLVYAANWPERRIHAWRQLLIARAIENQCYVAGVNRVGNDGNTIYHPGYSAVIDYKGEQISSTVRDGEEATETCTLQMKPLLDFRAQFAFAEDADEFRLM